MKIFIILSLLFLLFKIGSTLDVVNEAELEALTSKHEFVFVFFTTSPPKEQDVNQERYRKQIENELDQATSYFTPKEAKSIRFVSVLLDKNPGLYEKYKIKDIPSFFIVRGSLARPYYGQRSGVSFYGYIKDMMSKSVQLIDSKNRKSQFSTSTKVRVIGYFPDTKTDAYRTFDTLARFYANEITFGLVQDAKYAKSFKLKEAGEVALFKPNDRPLVTKVTKNVDEFSKWIDENKKPLWEELTYANVHSIWQGNPNFMVFINSPESEPTKKVISVFTNIAKEYGRNSKSQLNFVVVNGDTFKDFVGSLNLKSEDLPTFVIVNPNYHEEYVFPKTQSLSLPNAKKWIDLYLAGKLTPVERDLYNENDSVTKVNAETWESTVLDSSKDVFVEFYGVNCKFCQVIAPHYKQLGLIFSAGNKNIVIASFDTGKSTPPASLNITGIPTLLFFPANNKKTPILFQEQDRSTEKLFQFVMTHQTTLTQEEALDLSTRVNQYFAEMRAEQGPQVDYETEVEAETEEAE